MTDVNVAVNTDAKETKLAKVVSDLTVKLEAANVALASYIEERTKEELASNIEVGAVVTFKFGRGENRHDVTGSVIAVVSTPAGKLLKVLAGEGAGIKVYDVPSKQATVDQDEASQEVPPEPQADGAQDVDVDALLASL